MAAPVLRFKRGLFTNLPGLRAGEPGFTTDKYDLYVGIDSTTSNNQFVGSSRFWTVETTTKGSGVNLVEGSSNGTDYITLASPDSLSGIVTYYLPGTQGSSNSVLTNDGSGNLSWGSGSFNATFTGITTFSDGTDNTLGTTNTGSIRISGGVAITKNLTIGSNLDVTGSGTSITAVKYYGDGSSLTGIAGSSVTLGTPTDGDLVSPGALNTFTTNTLITDGVDDLNELILNVMKNTAVADVDFTAGTTAGGSPFSVTLSITNEGTANRFDIDWGDGNTDTDSTDSTPSHTYTEPAGGSFTVKVTAKNASGVGAGSSQSKTRTNYIVVYTPTPVVDFDLFRASTGGTALSGNDLYVVEGNSLYLDNNTTNTSVGAGVTYTMNWGDGTTADYISSDTVGGGASTTAARLQHTWAQGTNSGTGRDTFTLTLQSHSTALPASIPATGTELVKVYDDAPTDPDGLSSKTLTNVTSTGVSPKLTADADDRTGGTSLSAGDDVRRVTSGTATAGPIGSFAYNADSGTLTAIVNNSADGARALTSGDDTGTYTSLVIDSESDYQLLNSGGTSTTFANSIYYPNNWKGFKARVAKAVSGMSVGVNSMRMDHSVTGNTNFVEFVVDKDHTSTPTSNVGSATLTENTAGTKRFISGIPYYNTGSPDLTLSGVTINNLTGQTYSNVTNVVEVDDGTNQESTTSNAITNSDYTYANIDGSTTMLSSGIPKKNIGSSSAYAIGDLTVPITSSSVRTISRVKVRARNVNGVGSYSSDIATNVQVHTASQSGISEIAIAVADALGSTYDDDGKRIFDFSSDTTDTPSYTSSTNFYTNSLYSESSDPGIAGTREAVVRLGNIKHDQTNYSSGYLPAGPNLSTGRSGTQYFTFAFRRQTVANFDINITSSGITGLWIAAPGTDIDDTSGLNGWLAADTAYAGSGIPGSDTGNGGNGSNGCASTSGDIIAASTALSGSYTMTLGSENLSNATNNVALIRIALADGQSVTSLSVS